MGCAGGEASSDAAFSSWNQQLRSVCAHLSIARTTHIIGSIEMPPSKAPRMLGPSIDWDPPGFCMNPPSFAGP